MLQKRLGVIGIGLNARRGTAKDSCHAEELGEEQKEGGDAIRFEINKVSNVD